MQVTIDILLGASASAAFAPSNLQGSKADALFLDALRTFFFVTSPFLILEVDWSIEKLLNFRIALTEDKRNTEIIEIDYGKRSKD
jgi:hypothetical protein